MPLPLSGRRKSNHFLNSPTDTEERLISPPRGHRNPRGGQVARLRKNLGHFILYHEDLPRALVGSVLTSETTGTWHAVWGCTRQCGTGGEAAWGSVQG